MKKNGKRFGSDIVKAQSHIIHQKEYEELPLLTDEVVTQGTFKKAVRPVKKRTDTHQ